MEQERQIDITSEEGKPAMIAESALKQAISEEMARDGCELVWINEGERAGKWVHVSMCISGLALKEIVAAFANQVDCFSLKRVEAAVHECLPGYDASACDHPGVPCDLRVEVKKTGSVTQRVTYCAGHQREMPDAKSAFVIFMGGVRNSTVARAKKETTPKKQRAPVEEKKKKKTKATTETSRGKKRTKRAAVVDRKRSGEAPSKKKKKV